MYFEVHQENSPDTEQYTITILVLRYTTTLLNVAKHNYSKNKLIMNRYAIVYISQYDTMGKQGGPN